MKPHFFTFGSDPRFPFNRNQYVLVLGKDRKDCAEAFRNRYPNRPGSDCINCADYYAKEEWDERISKYYKGFAPSAIIVSDTVYGNVPDGQKPLWFYVPKKKRIIYFCRAQDLSQKEADSFGGTIDLTEKGLLCTRIFRMDGSDLKLDNTWFIKSAPDFYFDRLADMIWQFMQRYYGDPYLDAIILE